MAVIYEEADHLHEETVDIVLAQNREVRRQLVALKKEISDMYNIIPTLCMRPPGVNLPNLCSSTS